MTDRYKTRTFAPLDREKVIEACEKSIVATGVWLDKRYERKKAARIAEVMERRWFPPKTQKKALEIIEREDRMRMIGLSYYHPECWIDDNTKISRRILTLAKASTAKTINVTAKDFADFSKYYEA